MPSDSEYRINVTSGADVGGLQEAQKQIADVTAKIHEGARTIEAMEGSQKDLNAELKKVEVGSEKFKALSVDLQAVTAALTRARMEAAGLGTEMQKTSGAGAAAGGKEAGGIEYHMGRFPHELAALSLVTALGGEGFAALGESFMKLLNSVGKATGAAEGLKTIAGFIDKIGESAPLVEAARLEAQHKAEVDREALELQKQLAENVEASNHALERQMNFLKKVTELQDAQAKGDLGIKLAELRNNKGKTEEQKISEARDLEDEDDRKKLARDKKAMEEQNAADQKHLAELRANTLNPEQDPKIKKAEKDAQEAAADRADRFAVEQVRTESQIKIRDTNAEGAMERARQRQAAEQEAGEAKRQADEEAKQRKADADEKKKEAEEQKEAAALLKNLRSQGLNDSQIRDALRGSQDAGLGQLAESGLGVAKGGRSRSTSGDATRALGDVENSLRAAGSGALTPAEVAALLKAVDDYAAKSKGHDEKTVQTLKQIANAFRSLSDQMEQRLRALEGMMQPGPASL